MAIDNSEIHPSLKHRLLTAPPVLPACLHAEALVGGFWSYVAGTAYRLLVQHNIGGLEVLNYRTTLPMSKGLSSSAAACVMVRGMQELVHGMISPRQSPTVVEGLVSGMVLEAADTTLTRSFSVGHCACHAMRSTAVRAMQSRNSQPIRLALHCSLAAGCSRLQPAVRPPPHHAGGDGAGLPGRGDHPQQVWWVERCCQVLPAHAGQHLAPCQRVPLLHVDVFTMFAISSPLCACYVCLMRSTLLCLQGAWTRAAHMALCPSS